VGAALVLPEANTDAMNRHLAEISEAIAPGAHGLLVLDQARWHTTGALVLPDNMSLLHLPRRAHSSRDPRRPADGRG
jgi:hypothetical protein